MQKGAQRAAAIAVITFFFGTSGFTAQSAFAVDSSTEIIAQGKVAAFDNKRGNCLACHMIDDGISPGDLGPPLIAMKTRFPEKSKLRAQIIDPRINNPETRMPPMGAYKILSDDEIEAVVEYLYTL